MLTAETGCIRLIPGSHQPSHPIRAQGLKPMEFEALFGVAPQDFPGSIAVETNPGDLVLFNHVSPEAACARCCSAPDRPRAVVWLS